MRKDIAIGLGIAALCILLLALVGMAAPKLVPQEYASGIEKGPQSEEEEETAPTPPDTREVVNHVPLPKEVKAVYMTACVVGTPSLRDQLVSLVETTELNTIIIDIKDFSGSISFPSTHETLKSAWAAAKCGATDMKAFIASLHEKNIYVIGRITVFQDPLRSATRPDLAVKRASDGSVWKDHKGLSFIDVGAREHWTFIETLATESYNLGFDELNFDYIRFPSDGNMKDIAFTHAGNSPKQEALEFFFAHLSEEIRKPEHYAMYRHENTGRASATPYTSADIFGMTTTNTDDLNIGQVLERALPYFDFIAPMVYPSHYPNNFNGWRDPNQHTYELMKFVLDAGVRRAIASTTPVMSFVHERIGTSTPPIYQKPIYEANKIRPWLQDFDYPVEYTPQMVKNQIDASRAAGLHSYMFWDPSNKYTSLRQILKLE
jgi:hypothetical protein